MENKLFQTILFLDISICKTYQDVFNILHFEKKNKIAKLDFSQQFSNKVMYYKYMLSSNHSSDCRSYLSFCFSL